MPFDAGLVHPRSGSTPRSRQSMIKKARSPSGDQACDLDFLVAGRDLNPRPLGYEAVARVPMNFEVRAAPRSRVSRASVHSVEHARRGNFRYVSAEDEQ